MLRALIIGYGNPLRSDDGFGWLVAHQLAETVEDNEVEVIACHQLTPELAEPISRAATVVFIDASVEAPSGEVQCRHIQVDTSNPPTSFSHGFDAQDLLFSALSLYGTTPSAHLISVGGESFEMGQELTPTMQETLPGVLRMVQELVTGSRCDPKGE